MNFERDYLLEKWTKTRLLKDLSPDKSYEIAKMLELQASYLVKHNGADKQPINKYIEFLGWSSFQVIAKVFTDEELQFTFDTTAYPAFWFIDPISTMEKKLLRQQSGTTNSNHLSV